MARDLFSGAAHEYKESARETRLRRRQIGSVLIFSVVPIVYAFNSLKGFPVNVPVGEALDNPANQIILALIALLDMGVVVLTDLLGLNIVHNRGLGAAYIGCILLPILTIVLMNDQKRKKR